jgi:NAD(P)-dependent dehydrogenase (short-subunit alcohol dehydrogenase family)
MTQKVLITGASRGIGRATARQLGALGASVGINYRANRAAAESAADEVRGAGGQAVLLPGNVAREEQVVSMFAECVKSFGALDGVVINAGVVAPGSKLADMTGERMRDLIELNVLGALYCAREAARLLSRSRGGSGGSIVFVSSAASRLGAPGEYVDYAASKGALDSLTIGLSKELGREGVRVNAVRPGIIDTEIHATSGRADRAQVLGPETPIGRAGTADEVAEAIVWLLSDAASYVTGSFLDVAGGR